MLHPLSPARRRARLLAATALVSLTAACGPAGSLGQQSAGADAVGVQEAHGPTPGATDAPAPRDPATSPVAPVSTPGPAPQVAEPAAGGPTGIPGVEVAGNGTPIEPTVQATAPQPVQQPVEAPVEARGGAPVEARGGAPVQQPERPVAQQVVAAGGGAGQARVAAASPTAAAVTAAVTGTSGGSGGSYTDQGRTSFTAGNGQTGRYLRYAAGIDPKRPVGLVVYADGTGEYGVDNPTSSYALGGSTGLVSADRARNLITLAVESPNQSCECWHTGDTSAYADFLAQLIEKQLASYPISDVWLTGFSSGAQEVTRFLVPRHPELMRLGGGWVVFGGGGPPATNGAAVTTARMAGVRGHWYTGTADTAVPLTASWGAQAGERFYAARGVRTSTEFPAGVGHTLGGRLGSTVARIIDNG